MDAERWPAASAVEAYRDRVRDVLRDMCAQLDTAVARHRQVLGTVIEHKMMHHETLVYMLQELPREGKRRPWDLPVYAFEGAARARRVGVPAGNATLGASALHLPFGLTIWFNWQDPVLPWESYGLLDVNGRSKPAYQALQAKR